jgi:hypothetical protein
LTDTTGLISEKKKIEDSLEEVTNLFCERDWTNGLSVLMPVTYSGRQWHLIQKKIEN